MKAQTHVAVLALLFGCACASSPKSEVQSAPLVEPTPAAHAADGDQPAVNVEGLPFYAIGPVAIVDGVEISANTFNAEVRRASRMVNGLSGEMASGMKDKLVASLVDRALLDKHLLAHPDKVDESVIEDEVERMIANLGPAAEQYFRTMGVSEDDLREQMRDSIQLKRFLSKSGRVRLDPSDVRKSFDENPTRFDEKEQTNASHILLKVDPNAEPGVVNEAQRWAEQLTALARVPGADFAELAKEHSEGPSASRGGNLGYFPRGRMVPEFEKAAWALKPGEVSEPVRSKFGFHVIKVFERKAAIRRSFSDVEAQIRDDLEAPLVREAVGKLVAELRAASRVEEFPQNILDAAPSAPGESGSFTR